jgi:hypothetical protein
MRYGRIFVVLVCLATAMVVATTARADKPIKFPVPGPNGELPADICGFPVAVSTTQGNQHGKVYANGIFAAEGVLKLRLTNVTTGKSIDINASGPGKLIPQADGTTLLRTTGTSVVFFLPGQLGSGSPGALLLTRGAITELLDAAGNPIPGSFSAGNNVTDLCAALA